MDYSGFVKGSYKKTMFLVQWFSIQIFLLEPLNLSQVSELNKNLPQTLQSECLTCNSYLHRESDEASMKKGACLEWRADGGTVPCLCVIIGDCEGIGRAWKWILVLGCGLEGERDLRAGSSFQQSLHESDLRMPLEFILVY